MVGPHPSKTDVFKPIHDLAGALVRPVAFPANDDTARPRSET